jgi:hypothetical protein
VPRLLVLIALQRFEANISWKNDEIVESGERVERIEAGKREE